MSYKELTNKYGVAEADSLVDTVIRWNRATASDGVVYTYVATDNGVDYITTA